MTEPTPSPVSENHDELAKRLGLKTTADERFAWKSFGHNSVFDDLVGCMVADIDTLLSALAASERKLKDAERRLAEAGKVRPVRGSDMVLVERDLLGSAAHAIARQKPAPKTLEGIRAAALSSAPPEPAPEADGRSVAGSDDSGRILKEALFALIKTGAFSAGYSGVQVKDDRCASIYFARHRRDEQIRVVSTADAFGPPEPAAVTGVEDTFQARVQPWLLACFGAEIAADRDERNHRFLEEALELVQAAGCTESEALQLVAYVYGREKGEMVQEVGGVMVTLAALCLAHGIDMHGAADTELTRIWTKVEKIRAKQAAKPKHSPLPEGPAATPGPAPAGWTTNCCHCGRIIDTREKTEGGDDWGHEFSDGRWVCSPECMDVVSPIPPAHPGGQG